jgi:hypothetical protein
MRRLGWVRRSLLLLLVVLMGTTVVAGTTGLHWSRSEGEGPRLTSRYVAEVSPGGMVATLVVELILAVLVLRVRRRTT